MTEPLKYQPHSPKQNRIIHSEKRLTIAATGIQFGKTLAGALWMMKMTHMFTDPSDNFIITSPSFPILSQSTLPPFLALMGNRGSHDKKDNCFRIKGGGTVWFRTGTNPDSVVGLTDVRAILCDEAGLYSRYFWDNIQGRSSFCKAPIRIVTSPYSLNWLYKDYIRPRQKDPDCLPHVELIQATSRENPYFPEDEYFEKQQSMDMRRFRMMYGGAFDRMEGLVYDCFDENENMCDPMPLPTGTVYYAGVDWGYTNPFALAVIAVTPSGNRFQVSEHYETQLTGEKKIEVAKQKMSVFDIKTFYCDPSSPSDIEGFCKAGLHAVAANNDIRKGVDITYELIRSRQYKVFKNACPHSMDEFETYHYPDPKDVTADKNIREQLPVKQNEHVMDAIRYCNISTFTSKKSKGVVVLDEYRKHRKGTIHYRDAQLKKNKKPEDNTETWF
jgi:PBSX family phage terminase large subunit